jgi:hypothetical protein
MGDWPVARPLPTYNSTTQKNAATHPCLKRDSNPQSQCSSSKRQYVPYTVQLLGLAYEFITVKFSS